MTLANTLRRVLVLLVYFIIGFPFVLTLGLSLVENQPLGVLRELFPQLPWTLEHYQRMSTPESLSILLSTIRMALINAVFTVLVGYASARAISQASATRQGVWLLLFLSPFLVNSVVRLLSFQNFIGVSGPVQSLIRVFDSEFAALGWSHNPLFMHVGFMLQYLPFAILPLYLGFLRWDPILKEAAEDLGASSWQIFRRIEWPWMWPVTLTAFFLVLIPSFGEYIVPEILMGSRDLVWGQYITEAMLKWRNFPLGAALGSVVIFILLATQLRSIVGRSK